MLMKTQCGTVAYMAPEILKGKEYTESADIFSLGVILFALVTKLLPFEYASDRDWWFEQIERRRYAIFWMSHEASSNRKYDPGFKALFNAMVDPIPERRPTLEEVVQSEWMQGAMLDEDQLKKVMTKKIRTKKRRFATIKRCLNRAKI